jgi:DNA polymerase III epsilon subunit-like protein
MLMQTISKFPLQCKHVVGNPGKYAVLDTETTGLYGEVIELAIVDINGNILFDKLLRPKCKIEEGAMGVHGITEAMVTDAKTFAEEWQEIHAALDSRVIIAYNVDFDKQRLEHTAKIHGVSLPALEWRCLLLKYAEFYAAPGRHDGFAYQKLGNACEQQGVIVEQAHRARGDALSTASLIRRLAELGQDARRYAQ